MPAETEQEKEERLTWCQEDELICLLWVFF